MWGVLADLGMTGINNMFADERQDDAQNHALDLMHRNQAFNSAQAVAQRDWEERMSNTAYQRKVKDLQAAGLNVGLAYGGPASVPGGGMASSSSGPAGIASPGSSHSVAAGMQSAAQVDLIRAEEEKVRADAKRIEAEEAEIRERTRNYDPQRREIEARIPTHPAQVSQIQQNIAESSVRIERIWEEANQLKSSAAHLNQQVINLRESVPLIRTQIEQLRALTAKDAATTAEIKQRIAANLPGLEAILHTITAQDKRMAQPGRAAEAAAQDSLAGQIGAYLRAINPLNAFLRSAK